VPRVNVQGKYIDFPDDLSAGEIAEKLSRAEIGEIISFEEPDKVALSVDNLALILQRGSSMQKESLDQHLVGIERFLQSQSGINEKITSLIKSAEERQDIQKEWLDKIDGRFEGPLNNLVQAIDSQHDLDVLAKALEKIQEEQSRAIRELAVTLEKSRDDHQDSIERLVAAIQLVAENNNQNVQPIVSEPTEHRQVVGMTVKRKDWQPRADLQPIPLIDSVDLIYEK